MRNFKKIVSEPVGGCTVGPIGDQGLGEGFIAVIDHVPRELSLLNFYSKSCSQYSLTRTLDQVTDASECEFICFLWTSLRSGHALKTGPLQRNGGIRGMKKYHPLKTESKTFGFRKYRENLGISC